MSSPHLTMFSTIKSTTRRRCRAVLCALVVCATSMPAFAQDNRANGVYYPFHQYMPAGEAGIWMGRMGKTVPGYYQPIQFILPGGGEVTFFSGQMTEPVSTASPADIGLALGHVYRLQIRNLPDFPGVELYPTIELLDRLHPPPGHEREFPIPVELTADDVEHVLAGRMVSKVVYLEQPQVALPFETDGSPLKFDLPPRANLLAEADRLGRPLAIVRLGGRLPPPQQDLASFLWSPAPLAWEPIGPAQEASRPRETSQSRLPSGPRVHVSYMHRLK